MSSLLVVTSDEEQKRRLTNFFSLDGYSVHSVADLDSAAEILSRQVFDVGVFDLADAADAPLLRRIVGDNAEIMIIIAHPEPLAGAAVSIVNSGAYDSITHPYKLGVLYNKVEQAVRIKRLNLETQNLRGERDLIHWSGDLIGHSEPFQEVLRKAHKVAPSDASLLLLGESGTGKEVIAGVVHYNSLRRRNAFVRVNCAALHENLLETELFGHEKGAVTGAVNTRDGRVEQAGGGTIFLDEIGDMSLNTQAKVLRVLQEREFERVGGNRTISADVRVISATNKNLEEEIAEGRFREDLYYRLNVVAVTLPPLRERRDDIMPLARFFLGKFSMSMNKDVMGFDAKAEEMLLGHHWPGNIRELKNTVERSLLFADGRDIGVEDLGMRSDGPGPDWDGTSALAGLVLPDEGLDLEEVEKELVVKALEKADWVQKQAAMYLGLSPRVLNYKIKRFGITHGNWIVNSRNEPE